MTTLIYCKGCDWQKEDVSEFKYTLETQTCPGCGAIGVSWVRYTPDERAHASFVARRQVP
jgi:hypothetical protein